jgi:Mn-dependent DtxR family transcriptional regulator
MAMLESGEDYIETIYRLKKNNGVVYSIDVARELGYSRPSVSRAMGILRDEEYITMDEVGKEINLTEKGRKKAVEIYDKHKTLTLFLQKVAGVSEKIAETDACRIEHIISASTFRGIKNYMKSNP